MRYLAYDVRPGHALFGHTMPCPTCASDRQQQYLQELCGLTGEMLAWTRANTLRTTVNAAAYDAALALSAAPAWFYTLVGPTGVGKTRLLTMIVNEARQAGCTAVYTTTAELLDHLRAAYAPGAQVSSDGLLDKVTSCTVLALDECDRYNPTPWAEEKFFQLVERRYRAGDTRLTGFATNASLDALPQYVTSRLYDRRCRVFELGGPDLRRM